MSLNSSLPKLFGWVLWRPSISTENYEWHIRDLRKWYANALPEHRAATAIRRTKNPDVENARLINLVAAVECLARSILTHEEAGRTSDLQKHYEANEQIGVIDLLERVIGNDEGRTPETFFGKHTWEVFQYAVRYRDLSVHEGIFLGFDRNGPLLAACANVARPLMALYHIPSEDEPQAPASAHTKEPEVLDSDDNSPYRVAIVSGPDELLTKLFDWGDKLTQLLISAGYVGFLAAWAYTREYMSDNTERVVALLFVVSLSAYVFWNVFNSVRMAYFSLIFREEAKDPNRFPDALKRAQERMNNPGGPYEWIWLKVVLPLTYFPAIAGAAVMLSALAHGLFTP